MSRSLNMTTVVIALSMLLAASTPASPQGGKGHEPLPPGPGFDRLVEELSLSDEQVAKIEAIRDEGRKERIPAMKELKRLRHTLEGEMMEDLPDIGRVRDLAGKIGKAETDLRIKHLEARIALLEVLTEEQREMLPGPFLLAGGPMSGERGAGCHRGASRRGDGDRPGPRRHGRRDFGERFCPGGPPWRGADE